MSSKLLDHPKALCNQLRRIAIEAGEMTLDYFEDASCILNDKIDGSPVTLADQKAEEFIKHALKDLLPEIPFIGEETYEHETIKKTADYFWLVDPIDGTKEFIAGSGEYTVNIGLIHKGAPVIGVVYTPYFEDLYGGYGPDTAFKWRKDTGTEKSIVVRDMPKEGLTVMSSKSQTHKKFDQYLQDYKINKILKKGSSLKTCAIAAGKADLYPCFNPSSEWDTAAAQAVLKSAGGVITDADSGQELSYGHNRENKWRNPPFIASGFRL